jgi:hypothetical protein
MKHWLVYTISFLLLSSCGKKYDDGAISISLQKRDSLLIDYITEEFGYDEYEKSTFWKQLKRLRQDTTSTGDVTETLEAKFNNYHLKSFIFDSQKRPPFVVEITNEDGQFIDFFSFTDEEFYSSNSIDFRRDITRSAEMDSLLQQKINLEKNLNELIVRLNLKNEKQVFHFIETLCHILNMQQIDQDSVQSEVKAIYTNRISDSIYNLVKEEQSSFFKKGNKEKVLMVRTQSGLAYWRFWIVSSDDKIKIKTAFFSDILYVPMYI